MTQPSFFKDASSLAHHLQTSFPDQSVGVIVGVYDFFNARHAFSLEMAKKHCELLVVGLLPDFKIQADQSSYPLLQSLEERAEMLLGTQYVDYVIDLSCGLVPLIEVLKPHKFFEMQTTAANPRIFDSLPFHVSVEPLAAALDERVATEYAIAKVLEKLKFPLPSSMIAHAGNSLYLSSPRAIVPLQQRVAFLAQQHSQNNVLLTTNGSFDLLHPGHLRYLKQAKLLGGTFLVLVNDDASIQKVKGHARPIFNQAERMQTLAMLECVDFVLPFEGDDPLECLAQIKPTLHVKGGSFQEERIAQEKQLVESQGGKFQTFDLIADFSSTNLLERFIKRYSFLKSAIF